MAAEEGTGARGQLGDTCEVKTSRREAVAGDAASICSTRGKKAK